MKARFLPSVFKNKKIIIVGGTGTIGAALADELLTHCAPKVIRVLTNDENGLFQMKHRLKQYPHVRYLLGDVRDKDRMRWSMKDVDIVFHSAAHKHVALSEYNPFDAVKTNVLGTQNVIEACIEERVKKMIFISTDKAVLPTSIMGATKLLAERLVLDASAYRGTAPVQFSCVRFGNVLGSRGSIVPLIKHQIKEGGPVTITDKRTTRFIMSIREAVSLVLKAASIAKGGEIFILKMPSVRIYDLLEVLIHNVASCYGRKPSDIRFQEIGLRKGEKLHEDLMTETEGAYAQCLTDMFVLNGRKKNQKPLKPYSSERNTFLNKQEIKKLLIEAGLLEKE